MLAIVLLKSLGGANLSLWATVQDYTMCAGVMTYVNGQPTGALPGGLVRNPRSQAAQKLWVEQGSKPSFAPYETLLSESWSEHGVL